MIRTDNVTKSGGGLTPQQRMLLAHFDKMTEAAQGFIVELAAHNARVFPKARPQLRMIAGGAA